MLREPRSGRIAATSLGVMAAVLLAAAVALGASTLTVKGASATGLGKTVVVNPAGRTLYALSPETSHHLLCRTSACTHLWPPLIVPRATKLKAGPGVQGKLGLLRRTNGSMQVTLRGKPLYRYSGDSGPHESNGEGLQSFGGVWHAVTASSAPATSSPATGESSPAPMEGVPPYTY